MEKKRSLGIIIASGMNLLIGIFWLYGFISFISMIIKEPFPEGEKWRLGLQIGIDAFIFLLSLFFIKLGISTYKLIPKARLFNIRTSIIGIIVFVFFEITDFFLAPHLRSPLDVHMQNFGLIIYFVLLIVYFTRPKVKEQFK